MVKNLIISVLITLLPILIVISVYRYTLGYNPLHLQSVVDSLSSAFADSGNAVREFLNVFSSFYADSVSIADSITSFVGTTGIGFIDSIVSLFSITIGQIAGCFKYFIVLILLVGRLLLSIFGDLLKCIDLLYRFLIDSSPYVIDPYFVG